MKKFLIVVAAVAVMAGLFMIGLYSISPDREAVDRSLPAAMEPTLKLAKKGGADAQYKMGKAYLNGEDGLKHDYEKGLYWTKKALKQNNAGAQYEMALAYQNAKGVTRDFKKYSDYMTLAANNGNPAAMLHLANFYKDMKKTSAAQEWFLKAAEAGEPEAVNYQVRLYCGARPDKDNCWKWLPKSAEAGVLSSIKKMAGYYLSGEIGRQSHPQAEHYYTIAADNGDVDSMLILARSYAAKNGFTKNNKAKAFKYALAAAQEGNVQAMSMLSNSYKRGVFTEVSPAKAAQWDAKLKQTVFSADPKEKQAIDPMYDYSSTEEAPKPQAAVKAGVTISQVRNNLVGFVARYPDPANSLDNARATFKGTCKPEKYSEYEYVTYFLAVKNTAGTPVCKIAVTRSFINDYIECNSANGVKNTIRANKLMEGYAGKFEVLDHLEKNLNAHGDEISDYKEKDAKKLPYCTIKRSDVDVALARRGNEQSSEGLTIYLGQSAGLKIKIDQADYTINMPSELYAFKPFENDRLAVLGYALARDNNNIFRYLR
ncbi:TPR repeat protein [Elusimicrobium simillimum]|uniref:tetratricopeptide repeat protein n=1 Tax=Elusimicrobium simillimum TaxID=3143438 RepID=UPI003C6FE156